MKHDPVTERLLATVYFNTGQVSTFEEVRHVDRPSSAFGDYAIMQDNRETLLPAHSVQRIVVTREKRP